MTTTGKRAWWRFSAAGRSSPTASSARRPSSSSRRRSRIRADRSCRAPGRPGRAMSYILDALKKAERERRLGRARILEVPAPLARRGRRRTWPWLLVGAGLLSASALAWVFRPASLSPVAALPTAAPTAPATDRPAAAPAAPRPVQEPAPARLERNPTGGPAPSPRVETPTQVVAPEARSAAESPTAPPREDSP